MFDVPPPENDDDAFKLGNKIRKWIKQGRLDPEENSDDDYVDDEDDVEEKPEKQDKEEKPEKQDKEEKPEKQDKEEKPKKKRGLFGFFRR